jgi:hypothetical protein
MRFEDALSIRELMNEAETLAFYARWERKKCEKLPRLSREYEIASAYSQGFHDAVVSMVNKLVKSVITVEVSQSGGGE